MIEAPHNVCPDEQGGCGPLTGWLRRPHLPVLVSDVEPGARIILAMLRRTAVEFYYLGGSGPGELRSATPLEVFRVEENGPVYMRAWCHQRESERTFRLDRVRLAPQPGMLVPVSPG